MNPSPGFARYQLSLGMVSTLISTVRGDRKQSELSSAMRFELRGEAPVRWRNAVGAEAGALERLKHLALNSPLRFVSP